MGWVHGDETGASGRISDRKTAFFGAYRYLRHNAKQSQKSPQAYRLNHLQQPAAVLARRSQHRVDLAANFALQKTAADPLVFPEVSDPMREPTCRRRLDLLPRHA